MGRGAQLLLNVTPDPTGRIPHADRQRLEELGRELRRRFGTSVAEASGAGDTVTLELPRRGWVDHLVLMEDLAGGERVRRFVVEARAGGGFIPIGGGTAIGHERILPIRRTRVDAVRVRIVESVGEPRLRRVAAFDTGSVPPPTWDDPVKVWAADEAGRVARGRFVIDVTKLADEARTYRVRFVAQGVTPPEVEHLELRLGALAPPELLRPEPDRPGSFLLTLPGLHGPVELSGELHGPDEATVLLQKL